MPSRTPTTRKSDLRHTPADPRGHLPTPGDGILGGHPTTPDDGVTAPPRPRVP